MYRSIGGHTGRLLRRYDVIADFGDWVAIGHWDGSADAQDTSAGARLNVHKHYPDILGWSNRKFGGLRVELDIGRLVYEGDVEIVTEEPALILDIIGPLEKQ